MASNRLFGITAVVVGVALVLLGALLGLAPTVSTIMIVGGVVIAFVGALMVFRSPSDPGDSGA
jgi:hypothetical protein